MNTESIHSPSSNPEPIADSTLAVDDLANMNIEEVQRAYADGIVPTSFSALDGAPVGRVLAVMRLDRGAIGDRLRRFAASARFPWGGKSFSSIAEDRGTGINRVRLLGNHEWFPFSTSIGPSALDGQPCIVLDYDKPENPWFIRKIHDELRQVGPKLFLGPAMWKTKADPRLVLFFAIDTSR